MPDDRTIYEELIAPIESRMMRSVWRVVRHHDLAEDALQDALTVVWKRLDRIRRHPNPQALILRIALNAAFDALRRRKRLLRHEDPSLWPPASGTRDHGVSNDLEERELQDQVISAISRLPEKQAAAVLMRIVHEEPFDVIAQALGCSETTARVQVSKGRARLRQWLSHLQPRSFEEASQ